jgi:putative tricarboxylic transport membrane protein
MITMRHRDTCSAIVFLILALAVGLQAARFPMGNLKRVGPGFFPLILAALLGLLSMLLLIKGLWSSERVRVCWPARWGGIILVIAAIFAYTLLLKPLGFLLATFLFTSLVFKYADSTRWAVPLAGAAITTGLNFLLFKVWLAIPFPSGFLGY